MKELSDNQRLINSFSRKGRPKNPDFEKKMEEMDRRLGLKKVPFPKDGVIIVMPMNLEDDPE
jgi:hypothetical protein